MKKYYIYNDIDQWDRTALRLSEFLDENAEEEVEIYINSYGGDIAEGFAVRAAIQAHKPKTTAVITGIAASTASWIAFSCDEVKMARDAEVFIHRAWCYTAGNAEDMRAAADMLENSDMKIAAIYDSRLQGGEGGFAMMQAERLLNAEEAEELFGVEVVADAPHNSVSSTRLNSLKERIDTARSAAPASHEGADGVQDIPDIATYLLTIK